jgi:hypothetical protein
MDHGPCYRTHVRSPWSRSPADRFEVSINRVTSGTFVIAPLTGHFAIALLYPDLQSFFSPADRALAQDRRRRKIAV